MIPYIDLDLLVFSHVLYWSAQVCQVTALFTTFDRSKRYTFVC